MSHATRKARKRSGEKFVRIAKVGTPLTERSVPVVRDTNGAAGGMLVQHVSNRASKRLTETIKLLKSFLPQEAEKPKRKSRAKVEVSADV